jgi:hypothetical protein
MMHSEVDKATHTMSRLLVIRQIGGAFVIIQVFIMTGKSRAKNFVYGNTLLP